MSPQQWTTSRFSVHLGMILGRTLPARFGYRLVDCCAGPLSRWHNLSLVQSVAINQQGIHQDSLSPTLLRQAIEAVFRQAGRSFIDLYDSLKSPAALQQKIVENTALERLLEFSHNRRSGAFIVVPHLSSFDLMLLAAAARGFKAKVLTFGKPTGGYLLQNRIRALSGLEILPLSPATQRRAIRALQQGELVLTAIDRPIPNQPRTLNFFGRPSPLPDGHVRMALKANVPILVAAVHTNLKGRYELDLSRPLEMLRNADPLTEIRQNAERILRRIEILIRNHPCQWQMFYPAWQQPSDRIPRILADPERAA